MRILRQQTDGTAAATGKLMHEMVKNFYLDMAPYAHYSLEEVFNIIKNIPFREDPPDEETIMRPALTLACRGYGGDCDDKAIAMAAYCYLKQIPYRFIAVRKYGEKSLHHVYTECYIQNKWIHADCTYNFNVLGREREQYAEYVII